MQPRHGKRVEQASGRQMVGFDALADRAGFNSSTMAGWPGHHTERRANASVLSRPSLEWPPSGAA